MAKNKKEKVSKVPKVKAKVKKSSFWNGFTITSAVIAVFFSIFCMKAYLCFTDIPELPSIDLSEYWGPKGSQSKAKDTSIRPFRVVFTDSMQHEIRYAFEYYRRDSNNSKSFNETGWTYGVNSEGFTEYFSTLVFSYHFKERAKFLNQFDHFLTNIQGLDIHFMHVKPKLINKNLKVVPLLLLHGWPGSVREFYEAIPRLVAPRAGHNFVFEVIAPSLPGFIYSQGATRPGLNPVKIAVIMRNLMHRLGHKTFYVQGGDFGHTIGSHMATLFPREVLGFHTNMPAIYTKHAILAWLLGGLWPSWMAGDYVDRMYPLTEKLKFLLEESGYMHLQMTKPDTIGIALQDSAIGLASYILDRMMVFTDPSNRDRQRGGLEKYYTNEKLIDNIMMYWSTKSITTAMRLYKESLANSKIESIMARIPTPVPTWALKLQNELVYQPNFILNWKFPNLAGSSTADYGGHFAALERPKTFADDIYQAVKTFRRE